MAEPLLDRTAVQEGQIVICVKDFADRFLESRLAELEVALVRPIASASGHVSASWARCDSGSRASSTRQLSLEQHGGRAAAGIMARVAQRLFALAAGIWWNWQIGSPHKRSLVAYDH